MSETYRGVVVDASESQVIVQYDVNGDVVEQTYQRDQFIGQQLPELGTWVTVRVTLVESSPPLVEEVLGHGSLGDEPETRRRKLTGPDIL
jgi:hypothetical protein